MQQEITEKSDDQIIIEIFAKHLKEMEQDPEWTDVHKLRLTEIKYEIIRELEAAKKLREVV